MWKEVNKNRIVNLNTGIVIFTDDYSGTAFDHKKHETIDYIEYHIIANGEIVYNSDSKTARYMKWNALIKELNVQKL